MTIVDVKEPFTLSYVSFVKIYTRSIVIGIERHYTSMLVTDEVSGLF